jgi:hypothetical protein
MRIGQFCKGELTMTFEGASATANIHTTARWLLSAISAIVFVGSFFLKRSEPRNGRNVSVQ